MTEDDGCPEVYDNVGLDSFYRFFHGNVQLAWHGGLDLYSIDDPTRITLRVGALFQALLATRLSFIADPRLVIGLTNRDEGSDEIIALPVGFQYWPTKHLSVSIRTVIERPVDDFADAYRASLGALAAYNITSHIGIFAAFDLRNLYGDDGGIDSRSVGVGVALRL